MLLAAGRDDEARAAFDAAAVESESPDDVREAGFAHLGLAQLAGTPDEEQQHLARSRALLEPLGVTVTPTWPARR